MGYDISASGKDGFYSELSMPAMSFQGLHEQGYDWFTLIEAKECDGIYSGVGEEKDIKVECLKKALDVLNSHDPGDVLDSVAKSNRQKLPPEGWYIAQTDGAFQTYSPSLRNFMEECIGYCEKTGNKTVKIVFA